MQTKLEEIRSTTNNCVESIENMTWKYQDGTRSMCEDIYWLIDKLEESAKLLKQESTDNIAILEFLASLKE